MRIVHKGKLPEEQVWRGTCSHCRTVAEALRAELQVRSAQRDGDYGEAPCPLCKRRTIFYPKHE